jgi:hypothetical protein
LDIRGLQYDAYVAGVARGYIVRDAVVADKRGRENEDLTAVGRIGHRLSI